MVPTTPLGRVLFLYGSQTGNAESIATDLSAIAADKGYATALCCVDKFNTEFTLADERVVVFVVATHFDGDPPDNTASFWRFLKRKTHAADYLKNVSYTVLGLGDTNFTNFCAMGRNLDKRMQELGATPFYALGKADDAVGLEKVVEPWIAGLWDALAAAVSKAYAQGTAAPAPALSPSSAVPSAAPAAMDAVPAKTVLEVTDPTNDLARLTIASPTPAAAVPAAQAALPAGLPRLPVAFLQLNACAMESVPVRDDGWGLSRPGFVPAELVAARRLTAADAARTTLELRIEARCVVTDISEGDEGEGTARANGGVAGGDALSAVPEPGDAIAVTCGNDVSEVDAILRLIGQDPSAAVVGALLADAPKGSIVPPHLSAPISARDVLTFHCDVRAAPKKAFLRAMAEYATGPDRDSLLLLCSRDGASKYNAMLAEERHTLLHLLVAHPSLRPPFARLCELLPPLAPRYYSISRLPQFDAVRSIVSLSFAFNVLSFADDKLPVARKGVCTGYLEALSQPFLNGNTSPDDAHGRVWIAPRKPSPGHVFRAPRSLATPAILIGPGTGVAPFVGFLEARRASMVAAGEDAVCGDWWLFFGCRDESHFIFEEDLFGFALDGTLSHFELCMSRGVPKARPGRPATRRATAENALERRYVKDSIAEVGDEVWRLIQAGAAVFVCGDARNMAVDVHRALVKAVATHGGREEADADAYLKQLAAEGRYLRDVWA